MSRFRRTLIAATLVSGVWTDMAHPQAPVHEQCTLVKEVGAPSPLYESGPACDTRIAPASTFKIAIALMGFEEQILLSPDLPALPYDPNVNAAFAAWRQTTTPRRWLEYSVIWYSQAITGLLGKKTFQGWVDAFDYGNRDLSGDPGKNNGLTRAWLSSSLKISPREQLGFLEKLASRNLPVSSATYEAFDRTIERFDAGDGLSVAGKTGTGWIMSADGHRTKDQFGWFVGWFSHDGTTYVFARLTQETAPKEGFASQRTKASLLADLPEILGVE